MSGTIFFWFVGTVCKSVKLREISGFSKNHSRAGHQRAGERPKYPEGELDRNWVVTGRFSLVFAYVWNVLLFVC
jgi:hypothetical protein